MKASVLLFSLLGLALSMSRLLAAEPPSMEGLKIGEDNVFEDNLHSYSLGAMIGQGNGLSPLGGFDFLIVGAANAPTITGGIVVGCLNMGDYGYSSLVVGSFDSSVIGSGFIAGQNNSLTGGLQFGLGRGLTSAGDPDWNNATPAIYLGQFNVGGQSGTPPLLVVGNGTDGNNLSDALIIMRDGKIKIPKRQGDVGMGRFTSVTADQ